MDTFFNRGKDLSAVFNLPARRLLVIYGEGGIGKSALLHEARRLLTKDGAQVLLLDMGEADGEAPTPADRPQAFLRTLGALHPSLKAWGTGTAEVAAALVSKLIVLSQECPTYLFVDTTEVWQEDGAFWDWLESSLLSPLAVDSSLRMVFSGRVPPPFRRYEVRRIVHTQRLEPLGPHAEEALALASQTLHEANPTISQLQSETLARQALEFSYGHPELTKRLAVYMGEHAGQAGEADFSKRLCSEVVEPYIENKLFEKLDKSDEWRQILWPVSVLERFDPTILAEFLSRTDPERAQGKRDHFYIQGISRLRTHDFVLFQTELGHSLYGSLRQIMQRCFQETKPEAYRRALRSAGETYQELAEQFPPDDPERQVLSAIAAEYQQETGKESS